MKHIFSIFSVFVLFASLAHSQSCGIISDEAGRISNTAAVTQGASALSSQGVDPHVITVANLANYGGNAGGVLNSYLHNCRNWATANGSRNANLLVIVIAPQAVESFYGGAYDGALGKGRAANILAKTAVPFFKSKQFGEGVGATFKNYAGAIASYNDQAMHPVQRTVINQAVDPRTAAIQAEAKKKSAESTASIFKWFFFLLFLAIVAYVLYRIFSKRNEDRSTADSARQSAQAALQATTRLFRSLPADNPLYLELSGEYQTLTNSVSYDPNTTGLSAGQYTVMARDSLSNEIRSAIHVETPRDPEPPRAYAAAASAAPFAPQAPVAPSAPSYSPNQSHPDYYSSHPQTVVREVHHTTTYVDNTRYDNGNDMLTGVLLGEAIASNNERYREPEYQAPRYEAPSRNDDDARGSGSVSFDDSSDNSGGDSGSVSFDDSSDNSGGSDYSGGDSGGTDF